MEKNYYVGLDLGTSSIKTVLIDANGAIVAESSRSTTLIRDGAFIEFDAGRHYVNVCAGIRDVAGHLPKNGRVAALSMAGATGNALLADAEGNAICNAISWMDNRANLKAFDADTVRGIVGWGCTTSFPLAQFAWLKENRPELYKKAGRYCMAFDYLYHRLCGRWVLDYSTATTFHLVNQVKRDYHQEFLDFLQIKRENLSELTDSGKVAGELTPRALADTGLKAGCRLVTGCFDHPAAARACGVKEEGQLMFSCGTSWVGFYPVRDRNIAIESKVLVDPFLSATGGAWGMIFSLPCIGIAIDRFIDELIAPECGKKYDRFNSLGASAAPGADGLRVDLLGDIQTEMDKAKSHSAANIARAVMEDAANKMNGKIKFFAEKGLCSREIVMVGGPAQSPIWPEIIAQTTGCRILSNKKHNAGALGAALLARSAVPA